MASLQFTDLKPRRKISDRTSPKPLQEALCHIFSGVREGLWLVGGTALAGYYAEHRRSDDLDLFAVDPSALRMTIATVKALKGIGAEFLRERTSPYYYHLDVRHREHFFTVDVVLDENLHRIGHAVRTDDGVWVADLPTLFAAKVACLVSRCSEKDLFDLDWLFNQVVQFDVVQMIERGEQIDGGLNVETLLLSLQGASLRKEGCHFLLAGSEMTVEQVYQKILKLRKDLIQALLDHEKKLPASAETRSLARAVRDQRRLTGA